MFPTVTSHHLLAHILSEYGCHRAVDVLHLHDCALAALLAFFPPNDAARVGDIWMSYIASLISAYAKLRFPSLRHSARDLCFMANTSDIHFLWQP